MEIPEITIEDDTHIVYPERGLIFNKNSKRFTGIKRKNGYVEFNLNGRPFLNHRFIYEKYYGVKLTQEQQINHINMVKDDNRIDNLEVVSHAKNNQWRNKPKNNTSGYKGVYFNKRDNKYQSRIQYYNKRISLGYFTTAELAYEAYCNKAKELNNNHNCLYKI